MHSRRTRPQLVASIFYSLSSILALLLPPTLAWAQEEVIKKELPGQMYESVGEVRFKPALGSETNAIVPQPLSFEEALRTLELSGAAVRLEDLSYVRMKEMTRLEILRQPLHTNAPSLKIHTGQAYVTSRKRWIEIPVETPHVGGVPEGTEFLVSVDTEANRTVFTMFDGEVKLTNGVDTAHVRSGEQGIAEAGQPIRVVPILQATNIVQWWLYYPGVLDLEELELTVSERQRLASSLEAYRAGSLARALEKFPGYPRPEEQSSDGARAYLAALLLAVGAVERAEGVLAKASSNALPVLALRTMIDAVSAPPASLGTHHWSPSSSRVTRHTSPSTASEHLANSYWFQAQHDLEAALDAAEASVRQSPDFGFGWARVAELQFSFGRTGAARKAIEHALHLSPRNAQAHAVNGFLLAAENRIKAAIVEFDEAIQLDPGLGNAWLGRGLCERRLGRFWPSTINYQPSTPPDWLSDLQAAAAAEPHRSLLRSYAGKGLADAGDERLAEKELNFAHRLDTNDPTPLLYSALLKQQENRINEAISDLETSQELNDNRSLFRSRLLLDEDRAVRSANLASIYRDAGMTDVSVREAARAVTYDYANYSAHLFLANSFDVLRDPTRFNLRYETAWFNELLLANLLAPVGAGTFSQNISQQEYFRLFDVKKIGLTTTTGVRSDGQYRELVSQFGNSGRVGYSLDLDYQHNDDIGEHHRPNNGLDRIEWYSQFKVELTAEDTLFLLTKYQDYSSGDNFQYYDASALRTDLQFYGLTNVPIVRTNFTFDESQKPIVIGGYHHQWSPGAHTLLLGGRLENDQRFRDSLTPELIFTTNQLRSVQTVNSFPFDVTHRSQFEGYTAELNQIFKTDHQTLILGGRIQGGTFDTRSELVVPPLMNFLPFTNFFFSPAASNSVSDSFYRTSGYGYYSVQPQKSLFLTAGVSYDHVEYPAANFRDPPVSSGETSKDSFGPKAGLVYSPTEWLTLRGIYSRSLGGVSLDESYRLEPTELAGFIQSFRSVIPESVVGSVSAPTFETFGGAVDLKFKTGTYIGIQAQRLASDVDQRIGVFDYDTTIMKAVPSSTREDLRFREWSAGMTINQLLANDWSCGLSYKFISSELTARLPDADNLGVVTNAFSFTHANDTSRSDLHDFSAYLVFNHPCGFFARAEANWYAQNNTLETYDANAARVKLEQPGDQFAQFNLYLGWRFRRHVGDVTFGVLNLGGGDYHLNPLNSQPELPHERIYAGQLRLRF
jgi:tetratricopeptide (TPR) repeat protein